MSVNGGAEQTVETVLSGNVNDGGGWVFSGRTKQADGDFTLDLEPSNYSIVVCATQSGANGRLPKRACDTLTFEVVACDEDTNSCATADVNGQVGANVNAWCGKTNPLNIHFEGDFGSNATVEIKEDGILIETFNNLAPAGDSCQYLVQWSGRTRLAGSTYTFSISGNGKNHSFSETCPGE